MYIITINYHRNDLWHTYIIKSRINAFHGFCMIYAKHPTEQMTLTKAQVDQAINLYRDEPHTQQAMIQGIQRID